MANSSHKRAQHLQAALNSLKNSAQFCKRVMGDDANLEELQNIALKYAQMDVDYNQFEKNLTDVKNFFKENENKHSTISVEEKFDEVAKKNVTPKKATIAKHPIVKEFNDCLEYIESNEVVDKEFVTPTDPVTKNPIKIPVKNPQCGHIYDRDTIKELIALRKNTRCPYIGCPALQYIKIDQLVVDEQLQRKINRYNFEH